MKRSCFFLVFLLVCLTAYPQKSTIIRKVAKTVAVETTENAGRKASKKMVKNVALSKTEKQVSVRLVKNVSRNNFREAMRAAGSKSYKWFAINKSKEQLTTRSTTKVAKHFLSYPQAYKTGILNIKKTQRYFRRTFTRLMVRSKDQFIDAKTYKKLIGKHASKMKVGYPKDGSILRANMLEIMPQKTKNLVGNPQNLNQAHHIVGKSTPKAAAVLRKYGIDINDPINGIFLPSSKNSGLKGTRHLGGHSPKYYAEVEKKLSNCKSADECYEALDNIKNSLYKGDLHLYKDESHHVNKVFTNSKLIK